MEAKKFKKIKKDCLLTLLFLYKKANAGHIGSSLSCLDILIYLYFVEMKKKDKFVLSKGHAAAALYTVLAKSGRIPEKLLRTFYADGTLLAAHPPCSGKLKEIVFGTGSLGHGLSLATGFALSAKLLKQKFNVYCLLSDGDCNEGSTWEAALFAAQHNLSNLVIIIDYNKLQAFGYSKEVINLENLAEKFRSFNFSVVEAKDGNSFSDLEKAFLKVKKIRSKQPKVIIAHTIKGKGVSFMEDKLEWHYWPMDAKQYEQAMKEIEENYA